MRKPKPAQRDLDAYAFGVDLVQERIDKHDEAALYRLLEKQIRDVLVARADLVKKIVIKRDGSGDITAAFPTETSRLQEAVDTLCGMVGAVIAAFIELRRQNVEIAKAFAITRAAVDAATKPE